METENQITESKEQITKERKMEETKFKTVENAEVIKEINRDEMVITHYISTRTPDRYDEIMNPKGCDDTEYRKNPVVFFGHRARDLPIAKNIKLSADDYGVIAVTKFDRSDFAKEVFRLNTEGFLNSWSIGFIPLEQPEEIEAPPPTPSKGGQKYLYYERWKLLEYSSVPIPANPDAVNLMLKDIRDEKVKEVIEEHNYRIIRMKEVDDMINEKIETKWNEMMSMHSQAGVPMDRDKLLERVSKDDMRIFEDRLVRKLQEIIDKKNI